MMKKKLIEIGLNSKEIKCLPLSYLTMKKLDGIKYYYPHFESDFSGTMKITRKPFYKPISKILKE